jgi:hypothetical protein
VLGRTVRIGAERGTLLDSPSGRRVVLTTHPSALLRLKDRSGSDEAFTGLADDLAVAAAAAGSA